MLILEQFGKLILMQIYIAQEIQECFLFLKKEKNCFGYFTMNSKSFVNVLCNNLVYLMWYQDKMTQYNSLKLSNSQHNKLKSSIKNETEVILGLSSNMIDNSDDQTNFSHELLLTNRQVANLRKSFANN